MTLQLYALTEIYQRLMDEDEDGFATALGQLEGAIEEKAENVAKVIRSLEKEEEALRSEAAYLSDRARAAANKGARLKDYLLQNLEAVNMQQVKGRIFTIAIQESPPKVNVFDIEALPDGCKELVPASWKAVAKSIVDLWKERRAVYLLGHREEEITELLEHESGLAMRRDALDGSGAEEGMSAVNEAGLVPGAEVTQGKHIRIR